MDHFSGGVIFLSEGSFFLSGGSNFVSTTVFHRFYQFLSIFKIFKNIVLIHFSFIGLKSIKNIMRDDSFFRLLRWSQLYYDLIELPINSLWNVQPLLRNIKIHLIQSLEEELYHLGIFLLANKIQQILLLHFSW